jgi:hypothetical protein
MMPARQLSRQFATDTSPSSPDPHAKKWWFKVLQRLESAPHPTFSPAWWWDKFVIFTVFGLTGERAKVV